MPQNPTQKNGLEGWHWVQEIVVYVLRGGTQTVCSRGQQSNQVMERMPFWELEAMRESRREETAFTGGGADCGWRDEPHIATNQVEGLRADLALWIKESCDKEMNPLRLQVSLLTRRREGRASGYHL